MYEPRLSYIEPRENLNLSSLQEQLIASAKFKKNGILVKLFLNLSL